MDIVCDTSIWYRISKNQINAREIKEQGNRLLASPLNIIEIMSAITEKSYAKRKGAAQSILTHADEILSDAEYHLCSIWGLRSTDSVRWRNRLLILAQSKDFKDLIASVPIYKDDQFYLYRKLCYDQFVDKINVSVFYFQLHFKNKLSQYTKVERNKNIRSFFTSAPYLDTILKTTWLKAVSLSIFTDGDHIYRRYRARAASKLKSFLDAYTNYLYGCVVGQYRADKNDFGDLESFYYIQDHRVMFTKDRRWNDIMQIATIPSFQTQVTT